MEENNNSIYEGTIPNETESNFEEIQKDNTQTDESANTNENDFLEIKYNHQNISLSKDDAVKFASLGKRYSNLFEKINQLAKGNGKTGEEYIDALISKQVDDYRNELTHKLGEDNSEIIEKLVVQFENERKMTDTDSEKHETEEFLVSNETRLAKEFTELTEIIPELCDIRFEQLPEKVKLAAAKGENLTKAYLLYERAEKQKIESAKNSEIQAKNATVGKLNSDVEINSAADEFAKGAFC